MRWLVFLILLMSVLPAQARQSPEDYKTETYKMVYNMCRGGGYAYELEPQYASQRDRKCVEETENLISESEVRYIYHQQFEQAGKGHFPEGDKAYYVENNNASRAAFQNMFYIDYCIQKDQLRRGHVHEGQCAFLDQRVLDGPWKPIADFTEHIFASVAHEDVLAEANKLFSQNVSLPLHIDDLISKLESQGFTCEAATSCKVERPLLSYKDGTLVGFGSFHIGYKFAVKENMVVGAEAYSGGGVL